MLVSTGFVEDPWHWDIHFSECMRFPRYSVFTMMSYDGPIRGRNSETVLPHHEDNKRTGIMWGIQFISLLLGRHLLLEVFVLQH